MDRALAVLLAFAALSMTGCAGRDVPSRAPTTAPAPADDPQVAAPRDHSNQHRRTFGWVSVAVGSEAAVVAIVTSVMMLHEQTVRSDHCDAQKICSQAGIEANSTIGNLAAWNAGAWAVAAVGLGVGAWFVLGNPPDRDRATAVGVSPGGVTLRSTF